GPPAAGGGMERGRPARGGPRRRGAHRPRPLRRPRARARRLRRAAPPGRARHRVAPRVLAQSLGRPRRLRRRRRGRLRDRELRAQGARLSRPRPRVLALARARDLLVVGASDNHGWGKVTCVWNLATPGARGYQANRVLARSLALAQGDWEPWTAAYTQPWLMFASLSWSERSSWITWILVI